MTGEWPDSPFVGLRPFRSDEGLLFFGRRQQATELLRALYTTHFLAVVGSSGCGKSSLIQAGLIPRLTAGFLVESRDLWLFKSFTPGDAPRARLAAAFGIDESLLRQQGASAIVAELAQQPNATSHNCLLLVDQFEEIFTVADAASTRDDKADFVGILLALAAQRACPVFVVLTMRSDFLGDCDVFHGLPEAINQSHYLVPRLTRAHRQQAIEGPVRLYGQTITPQLVDRLLNELGDNQDQLPVMQHALLRTWEHWHAGGGEDPIDLVHYLAVGGVAGALRSDAEAALGELSEADRPVAVRVFQALTDTDVNGRPVRRYARLSDLLRETGASRDEIVRVLDRFRERGRSFVVVREDPGHDDASVHISHESLIRQWPSLAAWVDQERRSRDQYRRLLDLSARYDRNEEGLFRDPSLQVALDWREQARPTEGWARRYSDSFATAMSYLEKSRQAREEETRAEEEHRRTQLELAEERGRSHSYAYLLVVVTLLLVAVVGIVVVGLVVKNSTIEDAKSRMIAFHAGAQTDTSRALLYGVEAFSTAPTFEARSSLLTSLGEIAGVNRLLHEHTNNVQAVTFAPDGRTAASGGLDGKVVLWDLETGVPHALVAPKEAAKTAEPDRANTAAAADKVVEPDPVNAVTFSPDGRLLAAGLGDGRVMLWSAATRQLLATLHTRPELATGLGVQAIAFSPDGTLLAAGFDQGTLVLWRDVGSIGQGSDGARQPLMLTGGPKALKSIAFSPRGLLASAHMNGSLVLWDTEARTRIRELEPEPEHEDKLWSVAFSPDGRLLVAGGFNEIHFWDLMAARNTPFRHMPAQSARTVVFSRDGQMLVSGAEDGVRAWDIRLSQSSQWVITQRWTLVGHQNYVSSVAISPDSTRLLSGGWDSKVILWDLTKGRLIDLVTRESNSPVGALAWSRDGKRLAWVDGERRVAEWDFETRKHDVFQSTFPEATSPALHFDPDGGLLWSGVNGRELEVKNVQTGAQTQFVKLDAAPPVNVALSQDGRLLAYGTRSGQVVVLDLLTKGEVARFDSSDAAPGLAFSADGVMLASTTKSNAIALWDLATGKETSRLTGTAPAAKLTFSPDGRYLASAGRVDNGISVWSLEERRLMGVLVSGRAGNIEGLAFSPDGELLASADSNAGEPIRVWNLRSDALLATACAVANRKLTDQEWSVIGEAGSVPRERCGR